MKALITGINGFVGPYLQKELEAEGYEVFGLGQEKIDKVKYFQADIVDLARVKKIIKAVSPTHVYHLAGISSPSFAEKNSELTNAVNIDGTKNLLEACLGLASKPKVLVVSSSHVYGGPNKLPVSESHLLLGEGVYAESRIKQERVVEQYFNFLPVVVTRSFNHTGAGQPDNMVLPKIIKHIVEIKNGLRSRLELGNIEVKRDFTDVRDVVKAYKQLLECGKEGFTVNVCRGESIALKDVISHVKVLAQLDNLEIYINPDFVRSKDVLDMYGDNSLLKSYTRWTANISYNQMISDIYAYWKSVIKL